MKAKSWLTYAVYIILLFIMIYLRELIGRQARVYFNREYRNNIYLIIMSTLISVVIGMLIGLEHLMNEIRKEGIWKINLPKMILIGLPSLYFSLSTFLVYSNNYFLQNIIAYPILKLFLYGTGYVSLFQLIFGYVVMTSFNKYNKKI